jgi:PAS domain S-box-containing protein
MGETAIMPSDLDYQNCVPEEVLTALERVHVATVDPATLNDMLVRILGEILEIFDCDRAWLIYPCLLDASQVRISAERTKPEWPSPGKQDMNFPMNDPIRSLMAACLNSDGPVRFDPLSSPFTDSQNGAMHAFEIRSQLVMVLRPKGDDPWALGIHHCAQAHVYERAVPLFSAIGNRVADAIGAELSKRGLRQSEERFRTLVEHAPEAITMLDVDTGLYVDANPRAEALHGLSREELIGKIGPADLSPEIQFDGRPSSEAAPDYLRRALAGEFPRFEWMHLAPDGKETLCEVSLARLPDPHYNLVRASIFDITERKAAEAQRAELEAKLAQAQKMEAVGQLTGGIAHDFNNLLTAIVGNLHLISDIAKGESEIKPLVDNASEAAWRAATLTNRLLAFSRKQTLIAQVVDAGDLVNGMSNLLRRTLEESIDIEFVGAQNDLWRCKADPSQLENAILNLAINARDAMPDGGKLTIETANADLDDDYAAAQAEVTPGEYVVVSVTDTGTGMEPEVIEKVFEPFFTTKEVGKGSGLGLSMVYGFAHQSGGHVTVYSEEGVGTTVRIYLPRTEAASQKSQGLDRVAPLKARGETILVVEDDPSVRTMSVALLSGLGYEVLEAADGPRALSMLESSSRVNLLFTDVVLPGGMNGPELAAEIARRRPGIGVLYTSGYTEDAIIHQGDLKEGIELLHKPFRPEDLARKVRSAIDKSHA